MKKILGIILGLLLLSQTGFCALSSYYFLVASTDLGGDRDPATIIINKYNEGAYKCHYGDYIAVCCIQKATPPNITEIVQMESEYQIRNLVRDDLPNFDGNRFIDNL